MSHFLSGKTGGVHIIENNETFWMSTGLQRLSQSNCSIYESDSAKNSFTLLSNLLLLYKKKVQKNVLCLYAFALSLSGC